MTVEKPLKSAVLEKEEQIETPDYTDEEQTYLKNLQKRLKDARDTREETLSEFDDMTYTQRWQLNEDLANIRILPKKNKTDIQYKSGTLRTKLFAFLSSLLSLNLQPDISAYDLNDVKIDALGNAMEDVIEKTKELDNDDEKQMLRQYEMMKQGDVFVEEIWDDKYITEGKVDRNYNGQFRYKIKRKRTKQEGKPSCNIISGLSVYLGDINTYHNQDQPYLFTLQVKPYEEAKQLYEGFENWKYVSKKRRSFIGENGISFFTDIDEDEVEIIKYSDKPNHEYQIILNSVPMLPIGFPFPWGHKDYNISQQHYKPIRHDFAYGQSFISENKNPVQLLDEMMKFAYLKSQKSLLPPYINTGSRVISSQVFMPGRITMGIKAGELVPLSDKETQGVTSGEYNMIQELIKDIDRRTASQTFTGAREEGTTTATQIVELQRQARIMLGITIFSATKLEEKITRLRLFNILKNWFNPIDQVVDQTRQELRNKYRIVSQTRPIQGQGVGLRFVVPTEELPSVEQLMQTEEQIQEKTGTPVRIIALNPKEIQIVNYVWTINIVPREKRSSETSKLLFNAMIDSAMRVGLQPDLEFLQQRFAEVWEENVTKLFPRGAISPQVQPPGQPGQGQPKMAGVPAATLIPPSFEVGATRP